MSAKTETKTPLLVASFLIGAAISVSSILSANGTAAAAASCLLLVGYFTALKIKNKQYWSWFVQGTLYGGAPAVLYFSPLAVGHLVVWESIDFAWLLPILFYSVLLLCMYFGFRRRMEAKCGIKHSLLKILLVSIGIVALIAGIILLAYLRGEGVI